MTTKFYFTKDGSFGPLENDCVVDVKNFTKRDWEMIEACCDSQRQELAQYIEERRKGNK